MKTIQNFLIAVLAITTIVFAYLYYNNQPAAIEPGTPATTTIPSGTVPDTNSIYSLASDTSCTCDCPVGKVMIYQDFSVLDHSLISKKGFFYFAKASDISALDSSSTSLSVIRYNFRKGMRIKYYDNGTAGDPTDDIWRVWGCVASMNTTFNSYTVNYREYIENAATYKLKDIAPQSYARHKIDIEEPTSSEDHPLYDIIKIDYDEDGDIIIGSVDFDELY